MPPPCRTAVSSAGNTSKARSSLGIRLNWEKRYITLGPVATVLGLAFKLYDPEHLLGQRRGAGHNAGVDTDQYTR